MNEKIAAYGDVSDLIYLDNAATTWPKPESVYEFAYDFYRQYGGNAGRGNNPMARASARLLEETREKLAAWLNAPSAEQVIFTSSTTHALNLAILGCSFRPGDVVYVTPFEHNSVLRPVEHLRQTQGVEVRQIPFNRRTYACEIEKLQAAFEIEPPTMVCATQASNVCGVMPPVIEIARLAKAANPKAVVVVDAAQTAGLYPISFREGLIDVLSFSGHKSLYAFYGIAGFVLGTDWRPKPLMHGGTGTSSESVQMPDQLPAAYEAGSHNILATAGLYAALEWLDEIGREQIVQQTLLFANQLRDGLLRLAGIELFIPTKNMDWCGIISLAMEDVLPQTIENTLGAQNIAVRAGLHCSPWTHQWLKTLQSGGTTRLSPGFLNQSEEITKLKDVLEDML